MQKIYLKYDEYTPPVECDYGFVKEMLYLGFLYPLKKKNYKMYYAPNRGSGISINNDIYTIQIRYITNSCHVIFNKSFIRSKL